MAVKKKNPIYFYLFVFIALIVAGFFSFQWYLSFMKSPVNSNGAVQVVVVNPGESPADVGDKLKSAGLIRARWIFLQAFKSSQNPTIQAGDFKLSPAMSLDEIIKALESGSVDNRVTLLEGWRNEQIAQVLEKNLAIKQADFLKAAKEGYMFPDTYFFDQDATADSVAQILRTTFDKKFDDSLKLKTRALGLSDAQAVILASLVEREGRSDKVRQEVAGIMLRRLRMGMKLDIDATVRYALDTQSYKANPNLSVWWGPITQDDYSGVASPYNTYLNNGLPPAPICNPSLSSLTAVANANPNTPYLYYYHDSQGNSYYAKTLEEHNANVAAHR